MDANEIKTQVETAIENRDIGTARDLLNDLYRDNLAAGLVTVYPPKPGSPESIRRQLCKRRSPLVEEIESGGLSTDLLTDPVTGTVWKYSDGAENCTERYERVI